MANHYGFLVAERSAILATHLHTLFFKELEGPKPLQEHFINKGENRRGYREL